MGLCRIYHMFRVWFGEKLLSFFENSECSFAKYVNLGLWFLRCSFYLGFVMRASGFDFAM